MPGQTGPAFINVGQPRLWGQTFIPSLLPKLEQAKRWIDGFQQASGRRIRLEVDGGVDQSNVGKIVAAGADTLVAGAAIFSSSDYGVCIKKLRQAGEQARAKLSRDKSPRSPVLTGKLKKGKKSHIARS